MTVMSVLGGCSLESEVPPGPVTEADVIGRWCGLPEEVVVLNADHTFAITNASASFTGPLLEKDGYVDGYRVETEFGGVRPTSLSGTWTLRVMETADGVSLRVRRIADRKVDEGHGLGLEYDDGWQVTYSTDSASPEAERYMTRCAASAGPVAGSR
ncbi:hypothetical protein [Actinoplanes sp. NPDC049316]|uniref:hypothetical protein n=1 Tax=Actinoplanes sp. NPDC049316 TaxID=3154727 RepID=UPI003437DBC5